MLSLVLSSALLAVGMAIPNQVVNFDCTRSEGQIWWGCGSFGMCQGGQYSQVDCTNGTVYNRRDVRCSSVFEAQYPCGNTPPDCSQYVNSPGHRLPDSQQDTYENRPPCSYYYTCSYGRFLGYQACPNGTVYDEGEQRCGEPQIVPPPCGIGPQRTDDGQVQSRGLGTGGGQLGQGQGQIGQGQGQIGQGQGQYGQGQFSQGQGQGGQGQWQNEPQGQWQNEPQGQGQYGQGQGSPFSGSNFGQNGEDPWPSNYRLRNRL